MTEAAADSLSARWWAALLKGVPVSIRHDVPGRIARGRALVKGGRVHRLSISPGFATADVDDGEARGVSVRVRPFNPREWERLVGVLTEDLGGITALFEGNIPQRMIDRLHGGGLKLVPAPDDIDCECECGDHVYPCAHLAAVTQMLGALIDADPFAVLVLRGKSRDDLLQSLKRAWSAAAPAAIAVAAAARYPTDPWASPTALPALAFDFTPPDRAAVGLRALGPIPGDTELLRALTPLYEAGAQAALSVALSDTAPADDAPAALLVAETVAPSKRPGGPRMTLDALLGGAPEKPLGERLIDALALDDGISAVALAIRVDADVEVVRRELVEFELIGVVVRTGQARSTRWWIG